MNKSNERLMAILIALRKMPRWALILLTVGVIVVLGVAMYLLLPQTQESQDSLDPTGLAFSVFLKMGVVIILIVGLAIVLRRWQSKSRLDQSKMITVLETTHLSPHQTLYLINVDGQRILIGATDQHITNLYQATTDLSKQSADDFSEILAKTQSPYGHAENEQL